MKHYFIELTASYITKNKAHKAIQEFVRSYNHVLADEEGKGKIKTAIGKRLTEINEEFARCKDIELSGYFYDSETVSVDGNFILAFKDVRKIVSTDRVDWLVEHIPGVESNKRYYKTTLNEVLDNLMAHPDGDLANYRIWQQVM